MTYYLFLPSLTNCKLELPYQLIRSLDDYEDYVKEIKPEDILLIQLELDWWKAYSLMDFPGLNILEDLRFTHLKINPVILVSGFCKDYFEDNNLLDSYGDCFPSYEGRQGDNILDFVNRRTQLPDYYLQKALMDRPSQKDYHSSYLFTLKYILRKEEGWQAMKHHPRAIYPKIDKLCKQFDSLVSRKNMDKICLGLLGEILPFCKLINELLTQLNTGSQFFGDIINFNGVLKKLEHLNTEGATVDQKKTKEYLNFIANSIENNSFLWKIINN